MKKYLTENRSQTFKLGENFAAKLVAGDILLLYGELGAGKTTFVQGLAQGLGIKDRILSPTFVLIRQYKIPYFSSSEQGESRSLSTQSSRPKGSRQARTGNLYHIDLYRIEKPQDLTSLGLWEIAGDPASITVIEWADRIKNFKAKKGYKIYFEYLESDRREITIKNF